jgi:hypothetical protein
MAGDGRDSYWSKKKADFFVEICYNDMMRIVISKKFRIQEVMK